jgi:hypothetical protein
MRRKFPTPCRRTDQAATLRIVALGIPVPRQQRIQLIDLGASGHDALENISETVRRVDVGDLCVVHEPRENGPSLGAAFAAGEQMVFLSYPIGLMLRSMPSISTRPSSMKLLGPSQCSGCSGSPWQGQFSSRLSAAVRRAKGLEALDQRSEVGLPKPQLAPSPATANAIRIGVEHRDPLQRFRGRRDRPRTSAAHARSRTLVASDGCSRRVAVDLQDAVVIS